MRFETQHTRGKYNCKKDIRLQVFITKRLVYMSTLITVYFWYLRSGDGPVENDLGDSTDSSAHFICVVGVGDFLNRVGNNVNESSHNSCSQFRLSIGGGQTGDGGKNFLEVAHSLLSCTDFEVVLDNETHLGPVPWHVDLTEDIPELSTQINDIEEGIVAITEIVVTERKAHGPPQNQVASVRLLRVVFSSGSQCTAMS